MQFGHWRPCLDLFITYMVMVTEIVLKIVDIFSVFKNLS